MTRSPRAERAGAARESTGSLKPSYPDPIPVLANEPVAEPEIPLASEPEPAALAVPEQKLVVETQPDSVTVPPAEQPAAKSPEGLCGADHRSSRFGQDNLVQAPWVTPLSSDLLRTILFDDITEQRYQGLVFSTLRSLLRARLIAKMPWNYVDATNLSPHERRQWIRMAKSFGYEVQAVFFDVPLAVCMERNSKRDRAVSDEVMQKMAERLRPPNFKEGFDKDHDRPREGQPGTAVEPAALRTRALLSNQIQRQRSSGEHRGKVDPCPLLASSSRR